MEYDSLTRKVIILALLPSYPQSLTAKQLCERLTAKGYEARLRSIQRDLQDLLNISHCGLHIDDTNRPFKWSITADWKRVQLAEMDHNEALAFAMLERIGSVFLPNTSLKQLQQTFSQAKKHLKDSEGHIRWLESVSNKANHLNVTDDQLTLECAILKGRQISCNVKRFIHNKDISLHYSKLSPYAFVDNEGEKSLVFRVGTDTKLNQWPLNYFSNIKQLDLPSIKINTNNLSKQGRRYRGETILFECITQPESSFIRKLQAHQYAFTVTTCENNQVKITAELINSTFFRELVWSHATSIKVLNPPAIKQYIYRQTQRLIALSE
ncbi:hypothetical protein ACWXWU_14860 [Shewanella sp. A14]